MLTRIRIKNFKRLAGVDIELGHKVALIGPNNSGRTTAHLIQSVCLLAGLLGLLVGCAFAEQAPRPTPIRTPTATATPLIPTATPTLVVQRPPSPTDTPDARATRASPLAGRTTTEKPLGDLLLSDATLKTFHASANRQHYAYVTHGLFGWFVVWDGKQGKVYSEIATGTLRMSDDGLHIAYVAHTADQWLVVKDEQEVYAAPNEMVLALSRDGSRLVHSAGSGHATMLVDDKPGNSYQYVSTPVLSPDGRHVAYVAVNVDAAGRENSRMVRDGVEGKVYEYIDYQNIVFSPDSTHLVYPVRLGDNATGKAFVVVDGQEKKAYDFIGLGSIRYSPDGSRLAYVAQLNGLWFAVVNDQEGKLWENFCMCLSFSPDSKRLAYQGITRSAAHAVIDDTPGDGYRNILGETPVFSPDSRHTAFLAQANDGWLPVIDNREFGTDRYDGVYQGMMAFSPGSDHLTYAALKGGNSTVYVDGHPGNVYTAVLAGPAFDAAQHLSYLAVRDGKLFYVEESLAPAGPSPAIYSTPPPGLRGPAYYIPKFDLNFNATGSGPLSIAAGAELITHYRPIGDPKPAQTVKSLTLHVVLAQNSGPAAPALQFAVYANQGGWAVNGGHNHFGWGVNDIDIQFANDFVSRKGDVMMAFTNTGKQKIDVKSINYTLVTVNTDGTESTYQPQ